MDGTPDADALVRTLVELGRILGLVTLAEGIENQTQLDGLRAVQCDRGQGFMVSRPVEPEAVDALLDMTPAQLGLEGSPHALLG
jgi:EAL domain-containing protein (putative c-di-GMP-specific phosphodiesterase class I)